MDEYIKREALIENLNKFAPEQYNALVDMIIRKQPAADVVEVKHGEWLKTDAYPHRVYCSLCYKTYVTNEEIIKGRSDERPAYCREAKFCPHCGAKMDLKEGAEE